jgi:hypothetical protein
MKLNNLPFYLLLIITCLSCEKPIVPDAYQGDANGNLVVSVFQVEQQSFAGTLTRAALADYCSTLNFAVYDADGQRIKQVNQKAADAGFGAVAFAVEPGTYQVVVVGHSSSGNPTMADPKKIRFTNQDGYSDTFLYSTKVTVGEADQEVEVDANLHRITSLCRVVFTDAIPDKVTQMHFEYTGGSGAFDAATGLGSVKSTQKVDFEVEPGQEACSFDLYTILRDTEGTLHLKAMAQDANQNIIRERAFEVPMKQRVITKLSGPYFSGSDGSTVSIVVGINTDWEGEQTIEFN